MITLHKKQIELIFSNKIFPTSKGFLSQWEWLPLTDVSFHMQMPAESLKEKAAKSVCVCVCVREREREREEGASDQIERGDWTGGKVFQGAMHQTPHPLGRIHGQMTSQEIRFLFLPAEKTDLKKIISYEMCCQALYSSS